jgi:hypothetical protein
MSNTQHATPNVQVGRATRGGIQRGVGMTSFITFVASFVVNFVDPGQGGMRGSLYIGRTGR